MAEIPYKRYPVKKQRKKSKFLYQIKIFFKKLRKDISINNIQRLIEAKKQERKILEVKEKPKVETEIEIAKKMIKKLEQKKQSKLDIVIDQWMEKIHYSSFFTGYRNFFGIKEEILKPSNWYQEWEEEQQKNNLENTED